ncbi:MAG: hypothetical protein F4Z25_13275 [Chloroflexi bacterium]|nr:hypothetical protein [Chloroflexota bacterium]
MTIRTDYAEDHAPSPARPADQQLDASVSDAWSDFPWAERDPSASTQRLQTATWIEELLADVDRRER